MHNKMMTPRANSPVLVALAMAAGTTAYADPVRFDNDGTFAWSGDVFLDLTKPPEEQTGQPVPGRASFQYRRVESTCCSPRENIRIYGATPDSQTEGYPTVSVRDAGALFPNDVGPDWDTLNQLGYYYADGAGFYTQFDRPINMGETGDPGYMAARFDIDGAIHYGWMSLELTREFGPSLPRWTFELLAWGYETEPNTPIEAGAVPAPSGALALLAFGAAAGATRARRE